MQDGRKKRNGKQVNVEEKSRSGCKHGGCKRKMVDGERQRTDRDECSV